MKTEESVHIRYFPKGNKFQMEVPLNIKIQNVQINEEIIAECEGTRTIGDLLEQTKKNIIQIIQEKIKKTSETTENEKDVEIQEKNEVEFKENNDGEKNEKNDFEIGEISELDISFIRIRQLGYKYIPRRFMLCVIMSQCQEKTRLQICDKQYKVLMNVPKVYDMALPPVLYAPFLIGPLRLEGVGMRNIYSVFCWYRSKDKVNWEKVQEDYFYEIKKEDVGYYLKFTCLPISNEKIRGASAEVISDDVVLDCPDIPKCPFEVRHENTPSVLPEPSLRIVSYNILSSRYAYFNDEYSYCPEEFLAIDYRKRLVMKEILGYNADIICLQEVDIVQYFQFFEKTLKEEGFVTKFFRKGFYLTEGMMCAIRQPRLKVRSYEQVVFCNALRKKKLIFQELYDILYSDEKLLKKFLSQSQCMLVLTLRSKSRRILLGNLHLSHHPDNDDMRLIHSYMALRYLNYLRQRIHLKSPRRKVDIIICGDFNSLPNSPAIDFILNGELKPENYLEVSNTRLKLHHKLKLKSACGMPKYTTYTPSFTECIDYIFIEDGATEVEQVIPFAEEDLGKYPGLPNQVYPSDHLALVADIKILE